MVEYGENSEHLFLARDISRSRDYSEDTAQKIDREVKRLIDDSYAKAKRILTDHRGELDAIAKGLLEFETLDRSHIDEIMDTGSLQNPPSSPSPPDPPKVEGSAEPPVKDEDDGSLPGELAGAPA